MERDGLNNLVNSVRLNVYLFNLMSIINHFLNDVTSWMGKISNKMFKNNILNFQKIKFNFTRI